MSLSATCEVYLIIYHSPLFPAHWALFVPNPSTSKIGKVLNVVGSVAAGFEHEFKRNYDLTEDGRQYSLLLLDDAVDKKVVCDTTDEESTIDAVGRDEMERLALEVPAPGPSLNSYQSTGTKAKVVIRNCQTWLREAVEAYVKAGVLHEVALERLQTAPVN